MNLIYIPLDIFRNMPHNEIGELEAWLYFLGSDEPKDISRIKGIVRAKTIAKSREYPYVPKETKDKIL